TWARAPFFLRVLPDLPAKGWQIGLNGLLRNLQRERDRRVRRRRPPLTAPGRPDGRLGGSPPPGSLASARPFAGPGVRVPPEEFPQTPGGARCSSRKRCGGGPCQPAEASPPWSPA